jgi:hypothetical protein
VALAVVLRPLVYCVLNILELLRSIACLGSARNAAQPRLPVATTMSRGMWNSTLGLASDGPCDWDHCPARELVLLCFAIPGVIGSLSMLLIYWIFPSLQTKWSRLLVLLAAFDLAQGLFYVFVYIYYLTYDDGKYSLGLICKLQSYLNVFSNTASFLCTAGISIFIWLHIQVEVSPQREQRVIFWTFAFPTGYAFLACLSMFVMDFENNWEVVGGSQDTFGCYITAEYVTMRNICTYIPLLLSWVVTVYYYIKSQIRLSQVVASTRQPSEKEEDTHGTQEAKAVRADLLLVKWKMTLIPFTFILLRLPDFLYRLLEYHIFEHHKDWKESIYCEALSWAIAVLSPSQGSVNAVLFLAFSPRVRHSFVLSCRQRRIIVASSGSRLVEPAMQAIHDNLGRTSSADGGTATTSDGRVVSPVRRNSDVRRMYSSGPDRLPSAEGAEEAEEGRANDEEWGRRLNGDSGQGSGHVSGMPSRCSFLDADRLDADNLQARRGSGSDRFGMGRESRYGYATDSDIRESDLRESDLRGYARGESEFSVYSSMGPEDIHNMVSILLLACIHTHRVLARYYPAVLTSTCVPCSTPPSPVTSDQE